MIETHVSEMPQGEIDSKRNDQLIFLELDLDSGCTVYTDKEIELRIKLLQKATSIDMVDVMEVKLDWIQASQREALLDLLIQLYES